MSCFQSNKFSENNFLRFHVSKCHCLFVCSFRPDIDAWEMRHGLNELYGQDLVPEPKILVAMLHACRRLDDYPLTVRILESVKSKAAGSQEIYSYILQELKPTMEELGLSTPEELGLA